MVYGSENQTITTMNIVQVYKQFPTHESCIEHLERVRWSASPTCPYCASTNSSELPKEHRHHCNTCNTTYSVTVATIFHKTKIDLQKWFFAISLMLNAKKGLSARQLARDIQVNKDTALFMAVRIRKAMTQDGKLLTDLVEADETRVGGKDKNKHNDKKTCGTSGRSTKVKVVVVGVVKYDGHLKAKVVKDASAKSQSRMVNNAVESDTRVMTDE